MARHMNMSFAWLAIIVVASMSSIVVSVDACKVSSKTYSANDGTVLTDVAHLITFTAECPPNVVPVYAILNGRMLIVVRDDGAKSYQISWTQDMPKASSGSHQIDLYDDDGYQQWRKSQRSGSAGPKPLISIAYSHSSPFRGPFVQLEFISLALNFVLMYMAIVYRIKIANKRI